MVNTILRAAAFACLALVGCTTAPELAPGSKYVAMGSSFAAGPGITTYSDAQPAPCFRSKDNYAAQLARRRSLILIDVGCSGGTTHHLLGPRDTIPPQLDALTADTRLVTITIGGNDINYMSRLTASSCAALAAQGQGPEGGCRPITAAPTEEDYAALATRMSKVAQEVRRRSPQARLIFVDYLAVLPPSGVCAATPLSPTQADAERIVARRLAEITARAASENGADIITASRLSATHDACASIPWMNGYPRPGALASGSAYHPNLAGMTAVADALEQLLAR